MIDTTEKIEIKTRTLRQHHSPAGESKGLDRMMRKWVEEEGKPRGVKFAKAFRVMAPD